MKISGFTMVRNATKLYYPIKASIQSILPIVDEFVVALGQCDKDDRTEEEIKSIGSDKIRIVHTSWDLEKFKGGTVYAQQTNVAKDQCSGDWLFYIQSDEVVHEKYLPVIKARCQQLIDDEDVEGLLFNYKHFWGDYDHFIVSHAWYPKEIRIVRNNPDIYSWRDAQSFRRIPGFDGIDHNKKQGTFKLRVAEVDAFVYHYGYVRPPSLMQKKRKAFNTHYRGEQDTQQRFENQSEQYNYGDLSKYRSFNETHPKVMEDFIKRFHWKESLRYSGGNAESSQKHDRFKYKLLTFIEQKLLGGKQLFGFKNYKIVKQ